MDNEPRDRTSSAPGRRRPPYPLHKIAAAVARDETDGVVPALVTPVLLVTEWRSSLPTMSQIWTSPLAGLACVGY